MTNPTDQFNKCFTKFDGENQTSLWYGFWFNQLDRLVRFDFLNAAPNVCIERPQLLSLG